MIEGITEVHCHLLPGVDDGPDRMEETLQLLQQEYRQGVRRILFTPHFHREYFKMPRDRVREVFAGVCEAAAGMDMEFYLGCEFHRENDMVQMARTDRSYRMAGSRYILTEFSERDSFDVVKYHVTELLRHGYLPVIAHAERYPALRKVKDIRYLIDSGAYIQVNAGSILGMEGWHSKNFSRKLLKEGAVHLIGSDAHDTKRRIPCLGKCADYMKDKLGTEETHRILIENPDKIIQNQYI